MTDLDEKIAAKRKAKKKRSKQRKASRSESIESIDNESSGSGRIKSPPELQPDATLVDEAARRKPPPTALESDRRVGAHHVSNDSVSAAERTKFGATEGASGVAHIETYGAASSSDVPQGDKLHGNGRKKSPPKTERRVGAYTVSNNDISSAERTKFGAVAGGAGSNNRKTQGSAPLKSPPDAMNGGVGAHSVSKDDMSAAERTKFGATGREKAPGAHSRSSSDVPRGERLKAADSSGASIPGAKSPPETMNSAAVGAHSVSNADVSQAERMKFEATMGGSRSGRNLQVPGAKSPPETIAPVSTVGAHSFSNKDMTSAERAKFGTSGGDPHSRRTQSKGKSSRDLDNVASNPLGAHSAESSHLSMPAASTGSKFGGSTSAIIPGARAAKSTDMSDGERLKFGGPSSSSTSSGAMPGAHAETGLSHAERVKFGGTHPSSPGGPRAPGAHAGRHTSLDERPTGASTAYSRSTRPGAHSVRSTDVFHAERAKFSSGSSSQLPRVHAESDVSNAERVKLGMASASHSGGSMPGARVERSSDMSNAERVKLCADNSVGSGESTYTATVPGARQLKASDMSEAERVKFGPPSGGSSPGAKQASNMDLSSAERSKFGSVPSNSRSIGARSASIDDISEAERVKFGSSSEGGLLPGAKPASDEDMSNAERAKFARGGSDFRSIGARPAAAGDMSGAERVKLGPSSDGASQPGANSVSDMVVSDAERMKFESGPSGSKSGAQSATAEDVSEAERVKFESTSMPGAKPASGGDASHAERVKLCKEPSHSSIGVRSAASDDTSSAERLKFGAHDGNLDTRAAEAMKFGSAGPAAPLDVTQPATGDELRSESSHSQVYSEGEGLPEMESTQSDNCDIEMAENEAEGHASSQWVPSATSWQGGDHGAHVINYESEIAAHKNLEEKKAATDGWRNLCLLSSFIGCAIILGLSIGLGIAVSKSSTVDASSPLEVDDSSPPTDHPTVAPTTPPVDITWCYESPESNALEIGRYGSIRSVLVNSGVSSDADFSVDASYQRKALCWLSLGDRLKLEATDPFLRQRYALATLFYSLGEPEELLTGEWLSGKPECEWEMLECDPRTSSSVRRLHLQGNEIRQLPKELTVLQYVTYLDLSANLLDGDVSQVIGDWSHLEELRLSSNKLQSMPTGLDWKALKHLDVSSNYIQGPLPESLVLAKGLVYLDIALNGFTGTVPSELGNLTSLDTFYMHGNSLEGSMPQAICDLRYGQLRLLSADCNPPNSPKVKCACCSVCNDYDFDRNPFT